MAIINLESKELFWNIFDRTFDKENITSVSLEDDGPWQLAYIKSVVTENQEEPIESEFRVFYKDDEKSYEVSLVIEDIFTPCGSCNPENRMEEDVISQKLGAELWDMIKRRMMKNVARYKAYHQE